MKLINKIKCLFGYHDLKVILEQRYDILNDMKPIGSCNVKIMQCRHCGYQFVGIPRLTFKKAVMNEAKLEFSFIDN